VDSTKFLFFSLLAGNWEGGAGPAADMLQGVDGSHRRRTGLAKVATSSWGCDHSAPACHKGGRLSDRRSVILLRRASSATRWVRWRTKVKATCWRSFVRPTHVCSGCGSPLAPSWLLAIECLDLALLIDAEDRGLGSAGKVKPTISRTLSTK